MSGCTNVGIVFCISSNTASPYGLSMLLSQLTSDLLLHDQGHVRLQEEKNRKYVV